MANKINSVILAAARSPFHPKNGQLSRFPIQKTAGQVIKETTRRAGLLTDNFEKEVRQAIIGCATQCGTQGINVGRRAMIEAFGPNANSIFTSTSNSSCASSLHAIYLADALVRCGDQNNVIAGGLEATVDGQAPAGSDASYQTTSPLGFISNFFKTLWLGIKYAGDPTRLGDEILRRTMPSDYNFAQMNVSGDYIARLCNMDRERLDDYSARSFARAIDAKSRGIFEREIVPIDMGIYGRVDQDEIREQTSRFAQEKLKPTIKEGFHHAGSSSQFGVGASCVIVANEEEALKAGRTPLARIVAWSETGVGAGYDQLLGPLPAIQEVLEKTGLTINDIDIIEANEAYAGEALVIQDEFNIPDEKLNIDGGAIALTHPFGATGARLVGHIVHKLIMMAEEAKRTGKKPPRYGLATLCVAQGLGIAVIVERYDPAYHSKTA